MPHLASHHASGQSALAPSYQIHRYPASLIETRTLGTAGQLTLRPVLPQDDQLLGELVAGLSVEANRNRFHGAAKVSAERLRQMSCVDYQHLLALVVTAQVDGNERVIADARYGVIDDDSTIAEFALMVDERWQRHGVGGWALRALQRAAAQAGLRWLQGEVLHDNAPMLALAQRCGFALCPDAEDERLVKVQHRLGDALADRGPRRPQPRGMLSWLRRAPPEAAAPTAISAA